MYNSVSLVSIRTLTPYIELFDSVNSTLLEEVMKEQRVTYSMLSGSTSNWVPTRITKNIVSASYKKG